MATIEEIKILISAETRKFNDAMKKADKRTNVFRRSMIRLGGTIAAAFGTRALVRTFNQTIQMTDELIANAEALGVSAASYERWKFALDAARVPVDQLRQGLGDLQLKLGSPALAKNFKALGLDRRELLTKAPLQQLEDILRAAAKIENKTIKFRRLADVLGEESSRQLIKLIADGEAQLSQALRTADRFGSVLQDPKSVQAVKDWRIETLKMQRQWELVKQRVVVATLPRFQELLENLDENGGLERLADNLVKITNSFIELIDLAANLQEKLSDTRLARFYGGVGSKAEDDRIQEKAERLSRLKHGPPIDETFDRLYMGRRGIGTGNAPVYNQTNYIDVKDGAQLKSELRQRGQAAMNEAMPRE